MVAALSILDFRLSISLAGADSKIEVENQKSQN